MITADEKDMDQKKNREVKLANLRLLITIFYFILLKYN